MTDHAISRRYALKTATGVALAAGGLALGGTAQAVAASRDMPPTGGVSDPAYPVDAQTGRQLFLDDHLLDRSNLVREWQTAAQHPGNPILAPQTSRDLNGGRVPVAAPFGDGIVFDPTSQQWRVWYMSGWFDHTTTRTSADGINWMGSAPVEVSGLDYERNGHIVQRDGSSVCLDYTGSSVRYRMFRYVRERPTGFGWDDLPTNSTPSVSETPELYSSQDGVHWTPNGQTGPCGDNTSFCYDPFRRQWVFSVRTYLGPYGRGRGFHPASTFDQAAQWKPADVLPWVGTPGFGAGTPVGDLLTPQVYDVTCMPYESAMLGVFGYYRGPSNDYAQNHGFPKIIDLYLGISRDGYHYTVAPEPLLTSSVEPDAWNYGYLHMVGGGIVPLGDEVRIYHTAFSGMSPKLGHHMYAGAAMGLATLRRDGFCALTPDDTGKGTASTRRLVVHGRRLFLNLTTHGGRLTVTVTNHGTGATQRLDVSGDIDETKHGMDLSVLTGDQPEQVSLDFELTGHSRLYSFWFSDDSGNSRGYSASGPISWT